MKIIGFNYYIHVTNIYYFWNVKIYHKEFSLNKLSGLCWCLSGNTTFTNTVLYVVCNIYQCFNCIWRKHHVCVPDLWLVFRAQFVHGWCQQWTGLKWGQMEARKVPGRVWPRCVRWKPQEEIFNSCPLVQSRQEKKLLVLSKLWAPVSWSVQEGISAHPRGQIRLGRALGTNNLLFVQTSTRAPAAPWDLSFTVHCSCFLCFCRQLTVRLFSILLSILLFLI